MPQSSLMPKPVRIRVTLLLKVSQSVSRYVLVSSPLCGRLTFSRVWVWNFLFCLCGAPFSDDRPGLSFVSHSLVICLYVHLQFAFCLSHIYHIHIYYIHYTMHIIYTRPFLIPARYSRLCPSTH
jgi:hypothetical protein